jgi:hypothetical protein
VLRRLLSDTAGHPEELAYRCYLSVLAGFGKYLPPRGAAHIIACPLLLRNL